MGNTFCIFTYMLTWSAVDSYPGLSDTWSSMWGRVSGICSPGVSPKRLTLVRFHMIKKILTLSIISLLRALFGSHMYDYSQTRPAVCLAAKDVYFLPALGFPHPWYFLFANKINFLPGCLHKNLTKELDKKHGTSTHTLRIVFSW